MTRRLAQSIRKRIRERASGRCEYCQLPEKSNYYSHQVDHIIPPIHGGNDEDGNLAWACFQCNSAKTSNIASYDLETGALTPLFHPRQQQWDAHFTYQEGVLIGLTAIGRVTIRVLQINLSELVQMRLIWMENDEW